MTIQGLISTATIREVEYPQLQILRPGWRWTDEFNRFTLAPTNFPDIYTTDGTGTETIDILSKRELRLLTGSTAADDASVGCSEMNITRLPRAQSRFNARTTIRYIFTFNMANAVGNEVFVGVGSITTLTSIPTVVRHFGVQYDDTADANFRTTSANGATQVLEDTGEAGDSDQHRLEIDWTGDNAAEIRFYSTATDVTPQFTDTVTALSSANFAFTPWFFVEAEGNVAETLTISEWSVQVI